MRTLVGKTLHGVTVIKFDHSEGCCGVVRPKQRKALFSLALKNMIPAVRGKDTKGG